MALAVAAASLALAVAVAAPVLYVLLVARRELGALAVDPIHAASALELHRFPFHEAAAASGRAALAAAFVGQTRIAALGLCGIGIYFAWRGYANPRPRGWGPLFWVSAVCLFFFAPAALPKLSLQRADYAVTAVLGTAHGPGLPASKPRVLQAAVLPLKLDAATVLATRAGLAALAAAFLSLACHDAAYRLREAFIEFGLLEAESDKPNSIGAADEPAEEKPRRAARNRSRELSTRKAERTASDDGAARAGRSLKETRGRALSRPWACRRARPAPRSKKPFAPGSSARIRTTGAPPSRPQP